MINRVLVGSVAGGSMDGGCGSCCTASEQQAVLSTCLLLHSSHHLQTACHMTFTDKYAQVSLEPQVGGPTA